MSFVSDVKRLKKIKFIPLIFVCNLCEASHVIDKWFAPDAVGRSHGLEGNRRPLICLLLLFGKHNGDHLQIQTYSEISRFATFQRDLSYSEKLSVAKPPENLTFSYRNCVSDEDEGR